MLALFMPQHQRPAVVGKIPLIQIRKIMLAVYKFIISLIFWSFCESFHDLLNDRFFYINKIKVTYL